MKKLALILLLLPFQNALAQHVKIDAGILSTGYWNKLGLGIVDGRAISPSVNLGIDYLETKWFYLSSQIGYTRIGGLEESTVPEKSKLRELQNYLHLNTTFRAFVRKGSLTGYIGAGPYLNILTGEEKFNHQYYKEWDLKSYLGSKAEVGFHFDQNRIRFGLNANYMYSLSPTAKSSAMNMKNNNIGILASVGYKI